MTTTNPSSAQSRHLVEDERGLLEVLLGNGGLRFGAFQTKSGRTSPMFFNFGSVASGRDIAHLGAIYARAISRLWPSNARGATVLFGSAYKGIPLVVAIASAIDSGAESSGASSQRTPMFFTYNRKEAKAHGEGGNLVGHLPTAQDRVIIIDDVLTGGLSLRESITLLKPTGAQILGALVGIDREEFDATQPGGAAGPARQTAARAIEADTGVQVRAITTVTRTVEILCAGEVLGRRWIDAEAAARIAAYRAEFGR